VPEKDEAVNPQEVIMRAPLEREPASVRTIQAVLRTLAEGAAAHETSQPQAFITISRQSGCGGRLFAASLVEQLNALYPRERAWTMWDRELVEKAAHDHQIAPQLVESLEDSSRSWLEDFFSGMSMTGGPAHSDELRVYRRVATTIRSLAQLGRVVIVGRGGVFITRGMCRGIHVRLVAPLDFRIKRVRAELGLTESQARNRIEQIDRSRQAFHVRYGLEGALSPENFSITLNMVADEAADLARCVLPLIPQPSLSGARLGPAY
jgi:hypothetical protein